MVLHTRVWESRSLPGFFFAQQAMCLLGFFPYECNSKFIGALAQLVERNNGIVEVNGSTPLRSIWFSMSFFDKITLLPDDPIFGLYSAFQADSHKDFRRFCYIRLHRGSLVLFDRKGFLLNQIGVDLKCPLQAQARIAQILLLEILGGLGCQPMLGGLLINSSAQISRATDRQHDSDKDDGLSSKCIHFIKVATPGSGRRPMPD